MESTNSWTDPTDTPPTPPGTAAGAGDDTPFYDEVEQAITSAGAQETATADSRRSQIVIDPESAEGRQILWLHGLVHHAVTTPDAHPGHDRTGGTDEDTGPDEHTPRWPGPVESHLADWFN